VHCMAFAFRPLKPASSESCAAVSHSDDLKTSVGASA